MGKFVELKTPDGVAIAAYRAEPSGQPRGGVLVCQEIFGVNNHIRNVTDRFASEGYLAIAPALFDRVRKGVELGYDPQGISAGRELMQQASLDTALQDVAVAGTALPSNLKKGVVGYCWGGTIAWSSAANLTGIDCAVAYYGGGIGGLVNEQPKCPVLMHFGDKDQSIPLDVVEKVKKAHPTVPVHIYRAGHGFNCDERASYDKAAADIAWRRTIEFFRTHLG